MTLKTALLSALLLVVIAPGFGQTALFPIEVNGRVGYIDVNGNVVITPQFDHGWKFSEGFACVTSKGLTGFVDTSGDVVIERKFRSLYGCYDEFREGVASISIADKTQKAPSKDRNEKWGVVDKNGKVILFPGFTFLSTFREGLAFFHKGGLVGYLDRDLNIAIPAQFESAGGFYFGRARATGIDGSEFYIDKTGKRLFPNRDGGEFQDSKAFFKSKGKYGFIDLDGKVIVQPTFDEATHFGEGLAGVKVGKKWGFIDEKGTMIIAPKFDEVGVFTEGLVSVSVNGKWGFADREGTIVIEPRFDKWTYYFENGLCQVHLDGKTGYIDKTGKFVWPLTN